MKKVLIANRGEIVSRISRSCRDLGLKSVAIYSSDDFSSGHRYACDESVYLSGARVADNYINVEKIIEAAKSSGADAVHPGFGFLAENAGFAEACIEAGLIWIGPRPELIRKLGDKISAKEIAKAAGVPVLPQITLDPNDEKKALKSCKEFLKSNSGPALLKAAAGGGGRGMRVINDPSEIESAFQQASREALNFFGDATLFMERYLAKARHVEVQILGDKQGNCRHLFERDCSLQRKHQKIIEESPAPELSAELRSEICDAAAALASSIKYDSAGTVEFILDEEKNFHFLEVNTRLQVEHPVTEELLGLDLVALQILAARGDNLATELSAIPEQAPGDRHVIELRICAEAPDFTPQQGQIGDFEIPDWFELEGVRFDHALESGMQVTTNYDSMIGKLIVSGADRNEARSLALQAVSTLFIPGVQTNSGTHLRWIQDPRFAAADHYTTLLDQEAPAELGGEELLLLCSAAALCLVEDLSKASASQSRRLIAPGSLDLVFELENLGRERLSVRIPALESGAQLRRLQRLGDWHFFELAGHQHQVAAVLTGNRLSVLGAFGSFQLQLGWPALKESSEANSEAASTVKSDLPGRVMDIKAAVGDKIEEGDIVVVLESMKMEHPLRAMKSGTLEELHCKIEDVVEAGQALFRVDA